MDRLTGWDGGNPYVRECFERDKEQGGCEYMATMRCIWCEHNLATLRRLAEYEDSGLSPEELTEFLKKLMEAMSGDTESSLLLAEVIGFVTGGGLLRSLDTLAEYESTGMSPEQVRVLAEKGKRGDEYG